MSTLLRVLILLGVLLALPGCGISLQNSPLGTGVDGPSYEVTAEFADVAGMTRGGRVRIGPATVGRVIAMRADEFTARVTLRIRSDVELPEETEAGIEMSTALGDPYIALDVPDEHDGALLGDGDTIPLDQTRHGPEVEDSMALLANMLNNSGIEQARTIITETNTMLEGREGTVRDLLGRTEEVLASLDERSDEINRTLEAVNTLGATVEDNTELLDEALTEIRPAVDVLVAEQDNFDTLLGEVGTLAGDVQDAIDATEEQLVSQLRKLEPVLAEFTKIDRDVETLLTKFLEFEPLFNAAVPGDYLNLDAAFHVPDSVGGVLEGIPDVVPLGGGGATAGMETTLDRLLEEGE
ncbi:MCE family protein [Haloechinothrix sp. YIM 98757]|uniref:MCE family protein n=1 Tax=Haloechinothrix aidingensis TaxID=2752311 RepID=A0A838ADY4_9PSEU|nr:MCE family protein [Haloechinothrix aidingensis]MBA0127338.1 MCE family protein [Haloechinothrix aidingensis]